METTKEHWNQSNNEIPVFKVDPILVLILGFITCGLYIFIGISKLLRYMPWQKGSNFSQ
jgi:hypothetical protein